MVDWEEYSERLERIKMLRFQEMLSEEVTDFPPRDEILLRHELITPSQFNEFENRNIRIANLNSREAFAVQKAAQFVTWLESMKSNYPFLNDAYLTELEEEVNKDINVILNVSVSRKGWLIENILHPKKRFTILGERAERRKLFGKKEEIS